MAKIQKVSTEVQSAILRKSAYSLPNNPTDSGYKADDIRKAFYKPIIDATNSALTEIDRIVDELNATIKNQTEQVDFVTSVQGINYHGSDGFMYSYKDGVFSVTKYTGDAEVLLIPSEVCYLKKNYPVKTIKEKAFNGCAFTRVEIPASIETIERNAFFNCTKLKEVKFWGYTQNVNGAFSPGTDFIVPKKYLNHYDSALNLVYSHLYPFDTIESLVEDISKKITKSSTPGIVYGTTDDGAISTQSEISYDSEVIGNSLVHRTYDGYFDVADPVQEKHPVNKKYADTFGASVDFSIDQDYVLTLVLKDKNGKPLSQKAVDLPIESLVNVSNVNLERDQELSALERAYSEEKLNAWQTAKNNVSDIYNQYEQEYKAAQEREKETAKEIVRNAIDNMFADPNNFEGDGITISYNGYRKIKGIIDSNRELFGEDEYNALITALKSYSLSADIIKADEGTLTYSDVAKYHSGIRTASEFNRAGNEDKTKYGSYQNYLKAMYEKYAANGSFSTGTTTATNTTSASTSNANSSTSSSVSASKKEGASGGKKVSAKAFRDDYNLKKKYGTYRRVHIFGNKRYA